MNWKNPKLAIVVPCFNEELMLRITFDVLESVLKKLKEKGKITHDSFLLFIDDGSSDGTWNEIEKEHMRKPDIVYGAKLEKNVGHQTALFAGLSIVSGNVDAAVTIDADLQDDVDAIEEMVDKLGEYCNVVYGVRKTRKTDSFFKRTSAHLFYRYMKLFGADIIYDHADFRLMSADAISRLIEYKGKDLFLRGIIPSFRFTSDCVFYDRKERAAGKTKYSLKKMLALMMNGITACSLSSIDKTWMFGIMVSNASVLTCLIYLACLVKTDVEITPRCLDSLIIVAVWFVLGAVLMAIGIIMRCIYKAHRKAVKGPRYHVEKLLEYKKTKAC